MSSRNKPSWPITCSDTGEVISNYHDYLLSVHWQGVKTRFAASKFPKHCHICRNEQNLVLHHKSYKLLGREILNHLVYLCRECHEIVHYKRINSNLWWRTKRGHRVVTKFKREVLRWAQKNHPPGKISQAYKQECIRRRPEMLRQVARRLGKMNKSSSVTLMPFGKYLKVPIQDVPHEYLSWLMAQDWFIEKFDKLASEIRQTLSQKDQIERQA